MGAKRQSDVKNVNMLKYFLIIGYAAIVILAVAAVATVSLRMSDSAIKNKVSSLVSSLNVQMGLNMDSYLDRMETIATLAFASEETYKYDATDPDNDEYEAVITEKVISDKLFDLCVMDNFVDYGIVYRNNHVVGKMSNATVKQFGDTIFTDMEAFISRQRTNDGWAAGYKDDFKRIYYVKRIHENAVFVLSFYADELVKVFDNPETMSDISVRLLNENYAVLYSSASEETGKQIPMDIMGRITNVENATVLDDSYLVTVNSCSDSWRVVCSVPSEIILQETHRIRSFIILTALSAALLSVIIGMIFAFKLTKPVERFVTLLDSKAHNDQLTGILNKVSFEELTKNRIQNESGTVQHAMIIIDLDDFKSINDTLGHAYGDEVLAQTGSSLRAIFSTMDYIGRIGGDEFCVFVNTASPETLSYEEYIRMKCEAVRDSFRVNYDGEFEDRTISASIGYAFYNRDGSDFESLYRSADKALYDSKHKGKNICTVFTEGGGDEHE